MRKVSICVAVLLSLAVLGCGEDSESSSDSASDGHPAWLAQFRDAKITTSTTVAGRSVWVDESSRTVYMKGDCSQIERGISQTGDPFGPSPRDAAGNFTPGYATVCVD